METYRSRLTIPCDYRGIAYEFEYCHHSLPPAIWRPGYKNLENINASRHCNPPSSNKISKIKKKTNLPSPIVRIDDRHRFRGCIQIVLLCKSKPNKKQSTKIQVENDPTARIS